MGPTARRGCRRHAAVTASQACKKKKKKDWARSRIQGSSPPAPVPFWEGAGDGTNTPHVIWVIHRSPALGFLAGTTHSVICGPEYGGTDWELELCRVLHSNFVLCMAE